MFQGTGSDVGKSLLAAGFCRALVRRGHSVRPFKAQNMSNNAAVTPDGGEIGRAQALQARASGVVPSTSMNPVLLKPQSDVGAQLVVLGQVRGNVPAKEYQSVKGELLECVLESHAGLAAEADFVVVEGAGSAAEINLRANDIANMGFATAAGVPVVLIADIDRGGVIANLVGTWELLEAAERDLLRGYIINRFRGDMSLFDEGLSIISQHTNMPSFGILPFLQEAARLPQEDAMSLESRPEGGGPGDGLKIAVPRLAHISNFDDFDPLLAEPNVALEIILPGKALPGDADLVILPGSKTTMADLAFFREQGWDVDLTTHLRRGGHLLGICAGFQMLGRTISDPKGMEGRPGSTDGLGLLDMETTMSGEKTLKEVTGEARDGLGQVTGYEMHMGATVGEDCGRPFMNVGGKPGGAVSADGRVMGCYLHGLFAEDGFRRTFLEQLRPGAGSGLAYGVEVEEALDELARAMEEALDMDGLIAAAA
ncbi:MAG: cobyric acid synthase [Rhodospirillales bacterium]|nr:cobyric acid synthase [Rhodospirillales bacterium]